jgi:D-serine deaminase-like pyridoxal phosphate-dependent protein
MSSTLDWYQLSHPQEIDSPALLLFPERVKHNIQTAIRMAGDVQRLRPHVKTNKSPDAVRLMQEAGIHKFKCATIAEAEMLGMVWAKDVLMAYQPTGPKLQRFIELIRHYPMTAYSCLTDNITIAKEQAEAFQQAGLQVPVYIDINVGMNRTGIVPGPAVIELMEFISQQSSVQRIGLHVYDGHIRNPGFEGKEKEVNDCYSAVEALLEDIEAAGLPAPNVIVGGSPAFSVHCKRDNVECSPGTFIYWDKGYADLCPEQDFLPAAVLMTRIISLPADGLITTDLGHKSVAAENEIGRRVFILDDENLKAVSQSEEHLVLKN